MFSRLIHKIHFLRHPINFTQMRIKRGLTEELSDEVNPQQHYLFDQFTKHHHIHKWKVETDQDIGGQSTGSIKYENDLLRFSGHVLVHPEAKLERSPYVSFVYDMPFGLNVEHFNCLRLDIVAKDKSLKVQLTVSSDYDPSHLVYGYLLSKHNNVEEYYLPFEHFGVIKTLKDEYGKMSMEGMQIYKIRDITIFVESTKETDFTFELKRIYLVNDQEIVSQLNKFSDSPMFIMFNKRNKH